MGVETQPKVRLAAELPLSALGWACFYPGAVCTHISLSSRRMVQEAVPCGGRAWAETGGLGELLSAALAAAELLTDRRDHMCSELSPSLYGVLFCKEKMLDKTPRCYSNVKVVYCCPRAVDQTVAILQSFSPRSGPECSCSMATSI